MVSFAIEVIMAPKKARIESGESSQGGYDARIFVNAATHARYQWLREKVVIGDRGLECQEEAYRHDPELDEVRRNIITRGWQRFVDAKGKSDVSMSLEFLANYSE